MDPEDVERAVAIMTGLLGPHTVLDWSVPAGTLEWSCSDTVLHVADDLFGYACQVAVAPESGYPPFDIAAPPGTTAGGLLHVVEAGGALLSSAVRTSPPGVRGWHPYGHGDAGGFAAMGVVEVLVHTHDVAAGLGLEWTMPGELSRAVLARLWPGVVPGADPAATLLHHTGRAELDGVPAPSSWRWYGAPLGEDRAPATR